MSQHPYFQSPIQWHPTLVEAREAAAREGKRVFLQWGRHSCGGSRAMVEKTINKEEIAEFLVAHYACVAADADRPDPEVAALVHALPRHEPTPVCLYLSADGRLLHSTAGGRPAAVFLSDMLEASKK
jgi:Thioredoxin-like